MKKQKEYYGRLSLSFSDTGQVQILDEMVKMDIPINGVKSLAALGYTKDSVKQVLEKFGGWFGADGNANTFFPGLDVQSEVIPKPEDFVPVPFRLLSETVVAAGTWRSTDFSQNGVLKNAVEKFVAKPVYFDHNTDLNNWLGITTAAAYSSGYTDEDGNKIPGGIDGVISIDGKSNPKFARGAYMGAITSTSVTIDFKWKPSHDLQGNISDFNAKVGDYDENGKMYTRVATEVIDIYETSLVFKGADPFAKKLDGNSKVIKPDFQYAVKLSKFNKFDEEAEEIRELFENEKKFVTCTSLDDKLILSLQKKLVAEHTKFNKDNVMDPKLLALLTVFGFKTLEEATPDALAKFKLVPTGHETVLATELASLKVDAAKVTDLTTQLDTSKAEVTRLTGEKSELEPFAVIGRTTLDDKRAAVEKLYRLTVKDADAAVMDTFKKADTAALDGFLKQYSGSATLKLGATCTKCNSTEVSFRSSWDKPLSPAGGGTASTKLKASEKGFSHFAEN